MSAKVLETIHSEIETMFAKDDAWETYDLKALSKDKMALGIEITVPVEDFQNISFPPNSTILSSQNINGSGSNETFADFPDVSLSENAVTGLLALYILTTLFSITGNVFVVLVFVRGRRSRTDLRPFLINLAVADLLMAIFCMPFTFSHVILERWIFTKPVCTVVLFVQIFAVAGSVFTNMAIGIDRFLAVTFPLRSRVTYARAKYVIVVIWICAFSLASVQFFVGRGIDVGDGVIICQESWDDQHSRSIYTICILIFTYFVPLLMLSITYSIVGILLWKRTAPGNKDHVRDMHRLRSKIKIVKMLVIVVAVFGLCWLPIHVFMMINDYFPDLAIYHAKLMTSVYLGVHWLAMSNSFANPIIYGFTNESFRADLVTLFYMWMPCCGFLRSALPRTYSSTTNDSVILRRQSTMKSNWNNSTLRTTLSSKRLQIVSTNGTDSKRFLETLQRNQDVSDEGSATT